MAGYLVLLELEAVKEPFAAARFVALLWHSLFLGFLCSFQDLWWRLIREHCLCSRALSVREHFVREHLVREHLLSRSTFLGLIICMHLGW